ncbi:SGNH/GDSL hydrolase family protein [Pseudonocardia sp. GCM10023141]
MGSSFAAGPGIVPIGNARAGRSDRNYPRQVAQRLGFDLVDMTWSGATAADLLSTQVPAITADTELVTITAGGNDIGYIGSLVAGSLAGIAARGLQPLPRSIPDRIRARVDLARTAADVERARAALAAVVTAARERAPSARVVLVDYVTVIGPRDLPWSLRWPFDPDRAAVIRATAAGLAAAFAGAAASTGAELVRALAASHEHGVGSAEPWISGFQLGLPARRGPVPFHPTLAGMTGVAELVVAHLR